MFREEAALRRESAFFPLFFLHMLPLLKQYTFRDAQTRTIDMVSIRVTVAPLLRFGLR